MTQIDYYFSLLSPFTYLAGSDLETIATKHGATINYKPFDIIALYDRLGVPRPADRPQGRKDYRLQELRRISKKREMSLTLHPTYWPTNAAPASYAVIAAAKSQSGGDVSKMIECLFRAIWVENKDIADDAIITEALKTGGFDPMLSMTGMLAGADVYARNLEDAYAAGVFGSPFYFVTDTDERFWGQDRLEDLDAYLSGDL